MRTLITSILLAGACTVPDKQPATGDGGVDAPVDPDAVPETTITAAPAEFSNAGNVTFEFESNVPGARFMCSIDGEPAAACTSPFVRDLADGAHAFSVRAINASGVADNSPAEHLWSIDTVAPITTLTEAPPAADNSTMVRFSFMANEMFTSFECSLDGSAFASCRSGDDFGPVGDGAHSFAVRARDRAGNVDASPAVHAWQVDTSTPDTTLVSGPSGSVASATATFSFLSPDAGPGATFECSLDGSAFAACTSPVTYTVAMGVHTFSVRVRDANGNVDPTPATRTWTADITPPETTITDAPSGVVAMASASISFTSNEANSTYSCSLDGGPFEACTSPFNATGLAQGAHTFAVVATDEAGNADASPATASWTVDTETPTVMFTAGPASGATSGPYVNFAFTVSEGTPECRVDGGMWMPCAGGAFSFNHPEGAATFEVRIVDGAGNETIATRTFTVACAPAEITGSTVGMLRLDTADQTQASDGGGAGAFLGTTADAETVDPAGTTGRFGGALAFTAGEADTVTWPIQLGAQATTTVELWVNPGALSGTRDLVVSGDGRYALRVALDGSDVRFTGTVTDGSGVMTTVTSAPVAAGTWHLVVLSQTANNLTLYVDGNAYGTPMQRVEIALDTLRLGGNFGGSLDEVWVSTAGYTAAEALPRYCPVSAIRYN